MKNWRGRSELDLHLIPTMEAANFFLIFLPPDRNSESATAVYSRLGILGRSLHVSIRFAGPEPV